MGSAVALGLAAISTTVLGVDLLRPDQLGSTPTFGGAFYLLVGGTLGGIALAGVFAWWLLAPIGSVYRRGGLAVVSSFATILAMLVSMPVNQLWGRRGLAALAALALGLSLLLARRARRLAREE